MNREPSVCWDQYPSAYHYEESPPRAQLCPVCNGRGTVPVKGNVTSSYEETCHGCDGRGWVTVR